MQYTLCICMQQTVAMVTTYFFAKWVEFKLYLAKLQLQIITHQIWPLLLILCCGISWLHKMLVTMATLFPRNTRTCRAHLHHNIIKYTKFHSNCLKMVEVVRDAKFLQKFVVTMATLGQVQTKRVSCTTIIKHHHTHQNWPLLVKYCGSNWLQKVLVKKWLPWQRFARETQKDMSFTFTPQCHQIHQVIFQLRKNWRITCYFEENYSLPWQQMKTLFRKMATSGFVFSTTKLVN